MLDLVLGQIEGWFSCGELWSLWDNDLCGCGSPVYDCEIWGPVITAALAREGYDELQPMLDRRAGEFTANPLTILWVMAERRRRARGKLPQPQYIDVVPGLYASIQEATGARVIVDSSKLVARALMLHQLTDVELYLVHLVRDPRAVSNSYGKRKIKHHDPLEYYGQPSPWKSTASWLRRNLVIEATLRRQLGHRYLRLRYEDFALDPQAAVRSISALVGEPDPGQLSDDGRVLIATNHTVAGNTSRFTDGALRVRPDHAWKSEIPTATKVVSTLVASPLLMRYGYPLVPR